MTSSQLHLMPSWQKVMVEQMRAVGLHTRGGGVALIALLLAVCAMVINASIAARERVQLGAPSVLLDLPFGPRASIAFSIVAAFYAFALWKDEDFLGRSYLWMMPVKPHVHTLTKVLAGWSWVMAATTVGVLGLALISFVSSRITGNAQSRAAFSEWTWAIPFASATIAYLLTCAATVGTRQPLLWLGGIVGAYAGAIGMLHTLEYRDTLRVVRTAFDGRYGIVTAVAGQVESLDTAQLVMLPNPARWLGASLLWGGLGAALLIAMSYRRVEPSLLAGTPGPQPAIVRYKWLITSIIAVAMLAGLVATRFVKPEYEARATIWLRTAAGARASSPDAVGARLRSITVADTVARNLKLYLHPDNDADAPLLKDLDIADRFMPADYTLAVDDRAARWQLLLYEGRGLSDSGAVGDSIGRKFGMRWRPDAAALAKLAGREVNFTVGTPRQTSIELMRRLTVKPQPSSPILWLSLTSTNAQQAARSLNALSAAAVKNGTGAVLDSAATPRAPFKNTPLQVLATAILVGIAVATALVFVLSLRDARARSNTMSS